MRKTTELSRRAFYRVAGASSPRCGFTLIELIAVVILIGLMAATTGYVISGQIDQSRLNEAIDRVIQADQKERTMARLSPTPGSLRLDQSGRRLLFQASSRVLNLGSSIRISNTVLAGSSQPASEVIFSQSGQSPTYAVQLRSNRGASTWVLFVGSTGQALIRSEPDQIRLLMAMGAG